MSSSEKLTFEVTVVDQEEQDVVGMYKQVNMKNSSELCKQLWTEFAPRMKEAKWSGKDISFGISSNNNPATGEFDYICAVPIDSGAPVPEGMKKFTLKKGKCLRVFVPSLAVVHKAYEFMFSEYFPKHPEQAVDMKDDCFELYDEEYKTKNCLYLYFYLK